MKPASLVAAIMLVIIAVLHLLRLVFGVEVVVGGRVVPMWMSGIACVMPAALSVFVFREARSKPS